MGATRGENTLKGQNLKYLVAFVSGNGLVFFGLIAGLAADWTLLTAETLSAAVVATLVGALAIVLNGIVSGNAKAILVFWRINNPLPGCRAFSRYMYTDPRIDPEVLKSHHGPLPDAEEDQNRLWYRLYQTHAEAPSVVEAHRSYLLTKDLTALSGLFLVTLGPAAFALGDITAWASYYVVGLALIFLIASQAGRNYGKRLVTNVLATESARL